MNKILCITGMHRSGTSLMASWLQECGIQMDNGRVIANGIGNPKGHFEDEEFVDFHHTILSTLYPKSKGWIVFKKKSIHIDLKDKTIAQVLIDNRNNNYSIWGWKDPRSVVFLDFWGSLIPELRYVFIWRNVDDVVKSLMNRSLKSSTFFGKISRLEAYKTWIFYNKEILKFYKKNPNKCVIVSMSHINDSNFNVVEELNRKFNLNLNYYNLENIMDPSLISQNTKSFKDRLLEFYFKTRCIEKQLFQLSIK